MVTNDPFIGRQLGDYKIISLLGRGGMARVYKGFDERLDRFAAVKIIDAGAIGDDTEEEHRNRFQREAKAIARLNHPNIVGVYQFGDVDHGYYMAMEFIEGRDLGQILKENGGILLTNGKILRIMHDIAGALDYAHADAVIHRDVKPSNIMVTPQGRAILTDFGLALSIPDGTIGNTFGSAHYIAPEQALSSAAAVPQSDLYSLGVVLYQLLTGQVPFDDDSPMSVAIKHLNDTPESPRNLNPNVSEETAQIVLRLLAKDPTERYVSGESMVRALEKALGIAPTQEQILQPLPAPIGVHQSLEDTGSAGTLLYPASVEPRALGSESQALKSSATASRLLRNVTESQEMLKASLPVPPTPEVEKPKNRKLIWGLGAVAVAVVLLGLYAISGGMGDDSPSTQITLSPSSQAVAGLLTEEATEVGASATEDALETVEASATEENTLAPTATRRTTRTTVATATRQRTPTAEATTEAILAPEVTAESTAESTEESTSEVTQEVTEAITAEVTPTPSTLPIELIYTEETLVLYNRSDTTLDISHISFVQRTNTGAQLSFRADQWSGGSRPAWSLPSGDCFQVWVINAPEQEIPEDCGNRHSWRAIASPRWFWISSDNDEDAIFNVQDGVNVIATCRIAAGRCSFDPSVE